MREEEKERKNEKLFAEEKEIEILSINVVLCFLSNGGQGRLSPGGYFF